MIHQISIRPARPSDAETLARVYIDSWRATYPTILPRHYLDGLDETRIANSMSRGLMDPRAHYLVAASPQGVYGYIAGGPERTHDPIYRAEVYELYLLSAHQRQGTGRMLLDALARRLQQDRCYSLMVWVLAANPNRRFYERSGGIYLRSKILPFAGRRLQAAAYGWIDITLAMDERA